MDRSAAPWRVLDDVDGESAATEPPRAASDAATAPGWLTPRLIVGLMAAAALAVAAFVIAASGPVGSIQVGGGADWSSEASGASGSPAVPGEIVVDVQGAVVRPGVQRLPAGSRVGDAIAAAGGYGPRVDAGRAATELNLAAAIVDGDRIVVPARGDPAPRGADGTSESGGGSGDGLVDLNTATATELDGLPGVGPVTVQKIIDARSEKPFASVDELRNRKVVGAATFDKLRDLVTVR